VAIYVCAIFSFIEQIERHTM